MMPYRLPPPSPGSDILRLINVIDRMGSILIQIDHRLSMIEDYGSRNQQQQQEIQELRQDIQNLTYGESVITRELDRLRQQENELNAALMAEPEASYFSPITEEPNNSLEEEYFERNDQPDTNTTD